MPRNRHEVLTRAHRHDTPTLTQAADPKGHGRGSTGETRAVARGDIPPEVDVHVVFAVHERADRLQVPGKGGG